MSSLPTAIHMDLRNEPPRNRSRALVKLLVINTVALAYLVVLGLTYNAGPGHNQPTFLGLGILLGALCIYTFFYAGSRCILFSSMISYGHLLFVSIPAIMIGTGQTSLRYDLRPSVALVFLSIFLVIQILVLVFSQPIYGEPLSLGEVSGSFQALAMGFFATSLIADYIGEGSLLSAIMSPLSLVGIILSAIVVLTRVSWAAMLVHLSFLVSMVLVYAIYQFDGFGRIELASYLLSVVIVASWLKSSYLPKVIILVISVPGMLILSLVRVALVEKRQNRVIDLDESLGSVFGPFQSGAFILQSAIDGAISPTHGQSLLVSLSFWIPRSLWPDKPPGFGRAIVPVTSPDLVSSIQHSDAAPYPAELVWDFGVIGLVLCVVVVLLIALADRRFTAIMPLLSSATAESRILLKITIWACMVSMLLNYVWGGTFTYFSRTLTAIGIILMVLWLLNIMPRTVINRNLRRENFPKLSNKIDISRSEKRAHAHGTDPANR